MAWVRVMPKTCPRCGQRQFQCRRDCSLATGLDRIRADDRAWFAAHPEATERVRPFTVEEQLGRFITSGHVVGETARVARLGWWFTENGRRTHEALRVYETDRC